MLKGVFIVSTQNRKLITTAECQIYVLLEHEGRVTREGQSE